MTTTYPMGSPPISLRAGTAGVITVVRNTSGEDRELIFTWFCDR